MLGLRSPKVFVISFVTVILCSLTASIAVAQTSPPASTEKATGETSAVLSEPAKVPAATTTAKEETITPPTPIKTETEPAKVNNAAAPSTAPAPAVMQPAPCPPGARTITADVVAIPQPLMLNRLGATIPNGFVFALRSDTVTNNGGTWLRPGKRPRPIVLRANVGDCLQISFQNAIFAPLCIHAC